jgi:hypothetical protein
MSKEAATSIFYGSGDLMTLKQQLGTQLMSKEAETYEASSRCLRKRRLEKEAVTQGSK